MLVARLKARAHKAYFTEISQKGDNVKFMLYQRADIDVSKIPQFVEAFFGALSFTPDPKGPYFTFAMNHNSRTKTGHIIDVIQVVLEKSEQILLKMC